MQVTLRFPQGTISAKVTQPFLRELNEYIERGGLPLERAYQFFEQIARFEKLKPELASHARGRAVAMVHGEPLIADSPTQAMRRARDADPSFPCYVVEIPSSGDLPALFDDDLPWQEYVYEDVDGRISIQRRR